MSNAPLSFPSPACRREGWGGGTIIGGAGTSPATTRERGHVLQTDRNPLQSRIRRVSQFAFQFIAQSGFGGASPDFTGCTIASSSNRSGLSLILPDEGFASRNSVCSCK